MTAPHADRGALVEDIRRFLQPASVLDVDGTLAGLLRAQGIAADAGLPTADTCYDVVVCTSPPASAEEIQRLAAVSGTVLLAFPGEVPPFALEAFLECGFHPDLCWEHASVLLRRTAAGAGLASVYSELLRHKARAFEADALENQVAWLQADVQRLRRQVDSIVQSRIWRALVRAGSLALRLRGVSPANTATSGAPGDEAYQRWISDCEDAPLPPPAHGPHFTVILPAGAENTLASLRNQAYPCWDTAPDLTSASAEWLLWPGAGDEFAPDALTCFARAIRGGADLVYSDEDALDEHGRRTEPLFKPDWSPDLLLSKNYIGRAFAFRRDVAEAAGGLGEDDSYDFLLRVSARAGRIVHVPRVLYHRRTPRPSATREAIETALRARGIPSRVEDGRAPGCWRVRYELPAEPPAVEIIVPSRNAALLGRCLDSVAATAGYSPYSVAVIDNSASGELAGMARQRGARYVDWTGRPFNFSAMNNEAARTGNAPLLLFLNDDTTAVEPGWLAAMVELAARQEVGAVGARLLYPDGRIQHAGVVIGIFGVCGHAFKGHAGNARSYVDYADTVRNVSAVTGACLMVRSEVFREAGGFDEENFAVAYNDIDLCLRIARGGRRVLYTPHATLCHHEAFSKPARHRDPSQPEVRAFQARWRELIRHDPFYNPNLTRAVEDYSLACNGL